MIDNHEQWIKLFFPSLDKLIASSFQFSLIENCTIFFQNIRNLTLSMAKSETNLDMIYNQKAIKSYGIIVLDLSKENFNEQKYRVKLIKTVENRFY